MTVKKSKNRSAVFASGGNNAGAVAESVAMPRTTKLYDWRADEMSLDEYEKVGI
jgi:hypothetical protein